MLSKGFNKCGDMQYLMAEKAMKGEPFGMEVKIDGERILAHIKKSKSTENLNEFRLFTRNSSDYSDIYCILGSEILKSIKYDIDCIIDGEVAAWDTEFHEKLPFGSNQTVAREELEYNQLLLEKRDNSNSSTSTLKKWLKFTVFDIVYINGPQSSDIISRNISCRNKFIISDSSFTPTPGDITNLPLIIRQAILEEIIEPVKDRYLFIYTLNFKIFNLKLNILITRVEIINKKIVTSSDSGFRQIEIENFFTELIDKGEEGIVIKNLKSTYSLGTRSRELQNWVKLKPDYGNLTDDLDLIILGSYLGSGNNGRGWSYLMGVVDSTDSTKYLTVCKVGSGLSYKDQKELQSILQPNEHMWESRSTLPPHFSPWKIIKKEDVPNCWYPPDKSVVLQIKCNELIKTTNYSARICCRFPRVQKVRFDKPYTDIMNSNDLKEIFFRPKNTSETKNFRMESVPQTEITTGTSRNKRKKTPLPKQSNKLLGDNFTIAAVDDSSKESEIFKGILFCVYDSDYSEPIDSLHYSRLEIISIIQKHGGKVSANVPCDICVLGDTPSSGYSLSVKNCMAANCYDFVHFRYIIDCINNQNLLEINPSYYIKMSKGNNYHIVISILD
jgi:DNA ligase-4